MEKTILGIDHGNGNIKTASSVFPCGFKKQETKPSQIFSQDILEYKGCFYSLTPNRFSYEIDKTKNENCLILTLFAIAKEIKARAMKNADAENNAHFIRCIGFDRNAEFLEKFGKQGVKFAVEGHLSTGSYEKNGMKIPTVDVVVENIQFCESKGNGAKAETEDVPEE